MIVSRPKTYQLRCPEPAEAIDIPGMSIPVSDLPLHPAMEGSGRAFGIPRAQYASWFGGQIREKTSKLAKLSAASIQPLLHWRAPRWSSLCGCCAGFGSRLSSKIFLASALVILVFAGVSALSLGAVGRLVSVNREISVSSIPALTITASARDALPRLLALETRALVLGDPRYATAWTELGTQVTEDLQRLADYPLSPQEALHHREASAAFAEYRRTVEAERTLLRRGDRAGALRLTETTARVLAEQVRGNLEEAMAATRSRVLAAQAEAARLETGTWTAVLIALGAAVGLALCGTAIIARRMTRSLDLLSVATTEVAANAFREPIVIESGDEIATLARSFNLMASQLRQAEEAKREFVATV